MLSHQHVNGQAEISVGVIQKVTGITARCRLDKFVVENLQAGDDKSISKAGTVGSNLKVWVENVWLIGEIIDVSLVGSEQALIAEVKFLGQCTIGNDGRLEKFKHGISSYPQPGADVFVVTHDNLFAVFDSKGRPSIELGMVFPTLDVRAPVFIDPLLSRHFAIFGSTGTGKSTLAAALLHKIIERYPFAHVVLIDLHGEYSKAFPANSHVYNINNLKLPHWLMNFEEHCEALITSTDQNYELEREILGKCLLKVRSQHQDAKSVTNLSVDTPLPYAIVDLLDAIDTEMGKLEKPAQASSYLKLKIRLEDFIRDNRFNFMFDPEMYRQSLSGVVGGLVRVPNEGKPLSIIDMSLVPSEIADVVVALVSRIVLDYGMWSREEELSPVLLVCEEAQRYLPSFEIEKHTAAKSVLERIAMEGRKYGVSLGIICQRPSDLSETVLSQCGTLFAMRLNNARDQTILRDALSDKQHSMAYSVQSLRDQECVVCGEAVPFPVRVRIDDLAPELRPDFDDPVYTQLWKDAPDEVAKLEQIVARWVKHGM